jgi:hypothetical protein
MELFAGVFAPRRHFPGWRRKLYSEFFRSPPYRPAIGLETIELDDQQEGVWRSDRHRFHPKTHACVGDVATS